VNLWQEMLQERDEKLQASLAPEAWRFAANKYFREWLNDTRFQNA
jgi:hypothetical protein